MFKLDEVNASCGQSFSFLSLCDCVHHCPFSLCVCVGLSKTHMVPFNPTRLQPTQAAQVCTQLMLSCWTRREKFKNKGYLWPTVTWVSLFVEGKFKPLTPCDSALRPGGGEMGKKKQKKQKHWNWAWIRPCLIFLFPFMPNMGRLPVLIPLSTTEKNLPTRQRDALRRATH